MDLYADGWYGEKRSAEVALDEAVARGARPVGLIESASHSWGILYWSEEELSRHHRIDAENVIAYRRLQVSPSAQSTLARWWRDGGSWPGPQWRSQNADAG
jgi:hypothetical protein